MLWRWARRRHPDKGHRWVWEKYFTHHLAGLFAKRRERFGISYWILFDGALPGVASHLAGLLESAR